MRNNNPIMLADTDATLNSGGFYYLSYPLEGRLTDYLIQKVLCLNDRDNPSFQWTRPSSWFIGDYDSLAILKSSIGGKDGERSIGKYKFCNHIRPDALMQDVYEHLKSYEPPLVIISGFNNIYFKPSKASEEIDTLLNDLVLLQNDFENTTVLLAGTTLMRHGDLDNCVPKMNFPGQWEIETTACYNIPAPIGNLKLFHLPQEITPPAPKYSDRL